MYRLLCHCGQEASVRGSQAGTHVTCVCGTVNSVPTLSVLRSDQQQDQPSKAASSPPPEHFVDKQQSFKPSLRFAFGCGEVGPSGSISHTALTHYVQILRSRIDAAMWPPEHRTFSELAVSIALAPHRQMRIEFDIFPKNSDFAERDSLLEIVNNTEVPPVHDSPVAFALLLHAKYTGRTDQLLSIFPSLSDTIESVGLTETMRRAFDTTITEQPEGNNRPQTWWQGLLRRFKHRKPATTPAAEPLSAEQEFAAQEQWLTNCESQAVHHSWVELKQFIANDPKDFRYQIAYAEKLRLNESWASAIEWYDRMIDWNGAHAALLGRRAVLHYAAGNFEAALRDLNQAIEQAPRHALFRAQRSQIYCALAAWEQAVLDLDEAIRLTPIDPAPFFHRASIRLHQNQFQDAIVDLLESTRLDPNHSQAQFLLGWLYANQCRDKSLEAITHLSRSIALTPSAIHVWIQRSLTYLSQSKYELAIEDCQQALKTEPDNAEALGVLGRVLQCDGRYEESIAACSRSIELGHEHPLVYLARAISYASTGQTSLAVDDCDSSLAIEPDNAFAINFRGQLQLHSGDLDAAMNLFNRARELAPDWTEPREHLALVHRMKENPQAAVDEQTLLIDQFPQQASYYVNRAFAFTQMQAYADAASDYDRAIEIEPENERLYYLRGVFRMKCQEAEPALADFNRVLTIAGEDDNARAYRATLLLQLRRFQEAIDDFAQIISRHPDHPQAYSGRAIAFAAFGNTERADADTERLDEMAPGIADEVRQHTKAANLYRFLRDEEYDTALNCAEQMVAEYPDQTIGYRLRAHVRWEREEYVEAADDYTRVLESDGPTADCLSSRGQVRAELGEWDGALADLNQAVALAREQGQRIVLAYALNGRALTLSGMDQDEESLRDFDESVSLCPTNPWVYYHRGVRLFHLKQFKASKILLELALEFNEPPLSKRKKQRATAILQRILKQELAQ